MKFVLGCDKEHASVAPQLAEQYNLMFKIIFCPFSLPIPLKISLFCSRNLIKSLTFVFGKIGVSLGAFCVDSLFK